MTDVSVSPDRRHVACAPYQKGKARVVVDGAPVSGEYNFVGQMRFSPDGSRLAYWARRDKSRVFAVDGREIGEEKSGPDVPADRLYFSPDGKRLAYVAGKDGQTKAVVDGAEGKAYKTMGDILFSSDSKRIAYFGGVEHGIRLVLDGQEGPVYEKVMAPTDPEDPNSVEGDGITHGIFSADGKHVAYWGRREGKWFAVVDGQEHPDAGPPRFSPNSLRTAFAKADQGAQYIWRGEEGLFYKSPSGASWSVVVDGSKIKEHDQAIDPYLIFSWDSKRLAYTLMGGKKERVVLDGVEGKIYEHVSSPLFSPDSQHVAYHAWQGGKQLAVIDGAEGKPYDTVAGIVFSPDSKRLAYAGRTGAKWFVVVDGVEVASYAAVSTPRFGPDSRHVTYIAVPGSRKVSSVRNVRDAQWSIGVDGWESKESWNLWGSDILHYSSDKWWDKDPLEIPTSGLVFAGPNLVRGVGVMKSGGEVVFIEGECPSAR
jgi:roadblock/LC7 domain-containing protein